MSDTLTQTHPPKLLDQVSARLRVKHYSLRTEKSQLDWIKRYILHFYKRHPNELVAENVEQFLTNLAVAGGISACGQNQDIQLADKQTVLSTDIAKLAAPSTMRHSFAKLLLDGGYDIRTVQELLGHSEVSY